ncbi:MAG: hypothetical protein Rpha_2174 [Candidatus Ruthia sp. Apha_13_S6]|nr:hypothetical protein [Candidatus Ruthia sp. Apha_13_S6]
MVIVTLRGNWFFYTHSIFMRIHTISPTNCVYSEADMSLSFSKKATISHIC